MILRTLKHVVTVLQIHMTNNSNLSFRDFQGTYRYNCSCGSKAFFKCFTGSYSSSLKFGLCNAVEQSKPPLAIMGIRIADLPIGKQAGAME